MADKKLSVFARTEGEPNPVITGNADLDRGNIQATGIGLRRGELDALQAMANDLDVARNSIMRWGLRWFIMQYRSGKVDLSQFIEEPPPPKKKLRQP